MKKYIEPKCEIYNIAITEIMAGSPTGPKPSFSGDEPITDPSLMESTIKRGDSWSEYENY